MISPTRFDPPSVSRRNSRHRLETRALKHILTHPIIGNAFADADLMKEIHAFVMNARNSRTARIQALAKLDDVMGLAHPQDPETALDDYFDNNQEA